MLVRANHDGTFSANWTPGNVGGYKIHVTIDGCEMAETFKVSEFLCVTSYEHIFQQQVPLTECLAYFYEIHRPVTFRCILLKIFVSKYILILV